MSTGKLQLHVSGLEKLAKCGIQYEFRYMKGIKIPPPVAIITGIGVHHGIAKNLTAKIEVGNLLPVEAVNEITRDRVLAEWGNGVTLDEDEIKEGADKVKGAAVDKAVSLGSLHHKELAPTLQPKAVERPWVLDVEGHDIQLAGTIDIQEEKTLRDTKTAGKSPAADQAAKSVQLTAYALAVQQIDGKLPESVRLDYLVANKTPKLVQLESKRTVEDFPYFLHRVQKAVEVIKSGMFMPASPDSWQCSEHFCGYWNICPYSARPMQFSIGGNNGN